MGVARALDQSMKQYGGVDCRGFARSERELADLAGFFSRRVHGRGGGGLRRLGGSGPGRLADRDPHLPGHRHRTSQPHLRQQTRPVYLLDAVLDQLPKDLWLTRMEEKGTQLKFAGNTYSATSLSDFMSNLKASGKFKDVDIVDAKQDLTKSPPRVIAFEVVARFEP